VSACARCNHAKADRVIAELGWGLRCAPRAPTGVHWRILDSGRTEPAWHPYLSYGVALDESASA